jgi:hypothetical protein
MYETCHHFGGQMEQGAAGLRWRPFHSHHNHA